MWKYSSIGKLFLGITATLSLIALGSMRGTINEYWRWVFGLSHLAYFSEGLERYKSLSYVTGHTFYKWKRDDEMKKKTLRVFFLKKSVSTVQMDDCGFRFWVECV